MNRPSIYKQIDYLSPQYIPSWSRYGFPSFQDTVVGNWVKFTLSPSVPHKTRKKVPNVYTILRKFPKYGCSITKHLGGI